MRSAFQVAASRHPEAAKRFNEARFARNLYDSLAASMRPTLLTLPRQLTTSL